MVILDTNIIIDHLRQKDLKKTKLYKLSKTIHKKNLALSILSIQELYEGKSTKNKRKEQLMLATISPLKILPYNYETAKLAGKIARDSTQPIELADAGIAATAITNNAELYTLNKKDFKQIANLQLFKD